MEGADDERHPRPKNFARENMKLNYRKNTSSDEGWKGPLEGVKLTQARRRVAADKEDEPESGPYNVRVHSIREQYNILVRENGKRIYTYA